MAWSAILGIACERILMKHDRPKGDCHLVVTNNALVLRPIYTTDMGACRDEHALEAVQCRSNPPTLRRDSSAESEVAIVHT